MEYHSVVAESKSGSFLVSCTESIPPAAAASTLTEHVPISKERVPFPSAHGLKITIISDTHNSHRDLSIPEDTDILIHAGDFTLYGRREHAEDFNEWLGSLQTIPLKIVINGNHDCNSSWKNDTKHKIITNAIFLCNESYTIECLDGSILKLFGTQFSWSTRRGSTNPIYESISRDTDILVTHNPALGFVDQTRGCPALREICLNLYRCGKLQLVACGHIHEAYGVETCTNGREARPVPNTAGSVIKKTPSKKHLRKMGDEVKEELNRISSLGSNKGTRLSHQQTLHGLHDDRGDNGDDCCCSQLLHAVKEDSRYEGSNNRTDLIICIARYPLLSADENLQLLRSTNFQQNNPGSCNSSGAAVSSSSSTASSTASSQQAAQAVADKRLIFANAANSRAHGVMANPPVVAYTYLRSLI